MASFTFKRGLILSISLLLTFNAKASQNGTMMQYFHWYYTNDGTLWNDVKNNASSLAQNGITALWLPPAYKGMGGRSDVGYAVYDMYDLGEFNQKGTVRTKYGTRQQYLDAIREAHNNHIQIYGDVVLNHRAGADNKRWVDAIKVDSDNRNKEIGHKWIDAWVDFNFPGRNDKYSNFHWTWYHFDGVDWDDADKEKAIFKFKGKDWDWEVSQEKGNYDYLMFADIDMDNPEVKQELKNWGKWYVDTTNIDGFRLDAVKHIKHQYLKEWIQYLRNNTGKALFTVGEYWDSNVNSLLHFITKTQGTMSLFDAPLQMNFYTASKSNGYYDMRHLMDGTLVASDPVKAVTVVENHDTQPLQALESSVASWFKPQAYAFILLREQGYPCVFYADYYGAEYTDKGQHIIMRPVKHLKEMIMARNKYAYGKQNDYFDDPNIIGWTREGDKDHSKSMAVVMSDAGGGGKWMYTGKLSSEFINLFSDEKESVWTDSNGWAYFTVNDRSVSVWISQ